MGRCSPSCLSEPAGHLLSCFTIFLLVINQGDKDLIDIRFDLDRFQWSSRRTSRLRSSSIHFLNNMSDMWVNLHWETIYGWLGGDGSFYRIVSVTLTSAYCSPAVTSELSWQVLHGRERQPQPELRRRRGLNHQPLSGCQPCQAVCNNVAYTPTHTPTHTNAHLWNMFWH